MDLELMMWARDSRLRYRSAWGRTVAPQRETVRADPKNGALAGKMERSGWCANTDPGPNRYNLEESSG